VHQLALAIVICCFGPVNWILDHTVTLLMILKYLKIVTPLNKILLNTGVLASRNNPNGSDWRNVNNIYGSTSKLVAWIRIW
jgi:hypothetical protein